MLWFLSSQNDLQPINTALQTEKPVRGVQVLWLQWVGQVYTPFTCSLNLQLPKYPVWSTVLFLSAWVWCQLVWWASRGMVSRGPTAQENPHQHRLSYILHLPYVHLNTPIHIVDLAGFSWCAFPDRGTTWTLSQPISPSLTLTLIPLVQNVFLHHFNQHFLGALLQ